MVKVAVIGVGSMGRNHARVYTELPDVRLVAVADVDEQMALATADHLGTKAYTDYRQMLETERPEAVSIVVPSTLHKVVAIAAMEAGADVLVEKPIAATVEEGQTLIERAQALGRKLMVGHIERFNPAIIAIKSLLRRGELGRIFQIDIHRQGPYPTKVTDVGVVIDLAVHDIDVMRYITQAEVTRLYAETKCCIDAAREDALIGVFRLSNDSTASLTINWITPTKIRELFVTGEGGMFRVDYLTQDLYFYENSVANGQNWEALQLLRGVSEGKMIRHMVTKKEPLRAELEAFLSAVKGKIPVPVTGRDGLKALELAQSLIVSAKENRAITYPVIGHL